MLLYQSGEIKIRSSKFTKYLTISSVKNWILVDEVVFQLWLKLVKDNKEYERVVIHKPNGQIEILNICGNFVLNYSSGRGFYNTVLLRKDQCKHILQNKCNILKGLNETPLKTELAGSVDKNVVQNKNTPGEKMENNNESKLIINNQTCKKRPLHSDDDTRENSHKMEINNEIKSFNNNETCNKRTSHSDVDMRENYHCDREINSQKYFYTNDEYGEGL